MSQPISASSNLDLKVGASDSQDSTTLQKYHFCSSQKHKNNTEINS